ncbi:MAG: DinB family protein, partial [Phycisphaerales bacterium]
MDFSIEQTRAILSRTPGVLRAMLAGLDDAWVVHNYGPDTFSAFDVVGHLIVGERTDWMARLRIILEHGPDRPFDPFDRYAMYEQNRDRSMSDLLDEFERLRNANLVELDRLDLAEDQFGLEGAHPALGRVTLANLLATWAVHDLNHVAQIAKAMAYQYGPHVGLWRAYISIL